MVRFVLCLSILMAISACGVSSSSAIYQSPPQGAVTYGTGATPVDPDDYRVDSSKYPEFKVFTELTPPESNWCWFGCQKVVQVPIITTDVWRVTHVVMGKWLIESETYQDRQEAYVRKNYQLGANQHNYAVYITQEGSVDGGWELLPGSNLLFSERYMYMSFDPKNNAGWPTGSVFVRIK